MSGLTRSTWLAIIVTATAGILLILYVFFDLGIGLGMVILVVAALLYAFLPGIKQQGEVEARIEAEFPADWRPRVLAAYIRLRERGYEHVFANVLDEAHGDAHEVEKLCGIIESAGPQAFLEGRW